MFHSVTLIDIGQAIVIHNFNWWGYGQSPLDLMYPIEVHKGLTRWRGLTGYESSNNDMEARAFGIGQARLSV